MSVSVRGFSVVLQSYMTAKECLESMPCTHVHSASKVPNPSHYRPTGRPTGEPVVVLPPMPITQRQPKKLSWAVHVN